VHVKESKNELDLTSNTSTNASPNPQALLYPEDTTDCLDCRKYTEYVCTVGNKAGTMCDDTKGDCKKKACEAVAAVATIGSKLTDAEIERLSFEHAQKLIKAGYIDGSSFQRSKRLAADVLKTYNK